MPLREPLEQPSGQTGTDHGEVGQVVRPEPARRPRHEAAGDGDGEEERGGREGRGPRARADVGERERPGGEEHRGDGEVDDGGMDRKRRFIEVLLDDPREAEAGRACRGRRGEASEVSGIGEVREASATGEVAPFSSEEAIRRLGERDVAAAGLAALAALRDGSASPLESFAADNVRARKAAFAASIQGLSPRLARLPERRILPAGAPRAPRPRQSDVRSGGGGS